MHTMVIGSHSLHYLSPYTQSSLTLHGLAAEGISLEGSCGDLYTHWTSHVMI